MTQPPDDAALVAAITLAAQAHVGQVDKGGQPYILHPLRVMLACKTTEQRIAAVLHDTVEDCDVEPALIGRRFGAVVREAVEALTKRPGESYRSFIARCAADQIAREVKIADIADNMDLSRLGRDPLPEDLRRQRRYSDALSVLFRAALEPSDKGVGSRC